MGIFSYLRGYQKPSLDEKLFDDWLLKNTGWNSRNAPAEMYYRVSQQAKSKRKELESKYSITLTESERITLHVVYFGILTAQRGDLNSAGHLFKTVMKLFEQADTSNDIRPEILSEIEDLVEDYV
jgi:hypothetical protein